MKTLLQLHMFLWRLQIAITLLSKAINEDKNDVDLLGAFWRPVFTITFRLKMKNWNSEFTAIFTQRPQFKRNTSHSKKKHFSVRFQVSSCFAVDSICSLGNVHWWHTAPPQVLMTAQKSKYSNFTMPLST